ncbi:hypothetical protein NC651_030048 [Populus alba x Populus x berolinensis]|nr:hypothetical protein NC651_030043 [Populus alba x Populus x berolinensis]KAJ6877196.1 hypothetical protein NC651_030048 [Populus alba x Populus x berolinensis]
MHYYNHSLDATMDNNYSGEVFGLQNEIFWPNDIFLAPPSHNKGHLL